MALEAFPIHDAATLGDAALLDRRLREVGRDAAAKMERFNRDGLTALMCAVTSPRADSAVVHALIARGASVHRVAEDHFGWNTTVMTLALRAGDPEKLAELVRAGGDLRYEREGYTAALDCVHGRNGEHEDSYDPDFCIYNDVFVHDGESIRIYGYPEKDFPPTDFHSATLLGNEIWLIGSLGYDGKRQPGTTPIYSLDVSTFEIRRVRAFGSAPGWIYRHRAELRANGEILVSGGMVAVELNGKEEHVANEAQYVLETRTLRWRVLPRHHLPRETQSPSA